MQYGAAGTQSLSAVQVPAAATLSAHTWLEQRRLSMQGFVASQCPPEGTRAVQTVTPALFIAQ